MNKYSILAAIDVNEYKSMAALHDCLTSLKKETFGELERIIINYSTTNQLKLINELLTIIDIPKFFVVITQIESTTDSLDFAFSDSFCIYPWINLRIDTLGKISPCCKFNSSELTENIATNNIEEIYLGKSMSDLREGFRQGQSPTQCNICWREEAAGLESMRQRAKYKFREIYHKLDYEVDNYNNLQLLDLNLGNACNLSCRICNHTSSSTIAEMDLHSGRLSDQKFIELKQTVNWSETDEFWDQLLTTAQNLKYLDLYGGEPLMSKNHFSFLRKLIELDVAKNIQIDYNSNGTMYSEKFFDLWKHFKSVKISFSIDDIEDRFEYQRNGAMWMHVNDNIIKYQEKVSDKFTIDIFATINVQNVYYLPELLQWAQQINLSISFSMLSAPSFLSIRSIPIAARSIIITKLTSFTQYEVITNVITILKQDAGSENIAFIKYMNLLDSERQQNFAKSHTDIAKAMGYQ